MMKTAKTTTKNNHMKVIYYEDFRNTPTHPLSTISIHFFLNIDYIGRLWFETDTLDCDSISIVESELSEHLGQFNAIYLSNIHDYDGHTCGDLWLQFNNNIHDPWKCGALSVTKLCCYHWSDVMVLVWILSGEYRGMFGSVFSPIPYRLLGT